MKKITIKDVALMAKVSESTVSRVMSNSPLISENTKKKVLEIIKQLDYLPNQAAISLTKSISKIIAVVVENNMTNPLHNDFFTEILSHIEEYTSKKDYYIIYIHSNNNEDTNKKIKKLIKTNRVDGIIFLSLLENIEINEYLLQRDFPYINIGKPYNNKGLWVDNNNSLISYEITKSLLDSGLEKILFLSGPKELKVTKDRLEGYKKALEEKKIKIEEKNIISINFDLYEAENVMKNIIDKLDFEAIFTTDDILAIGCISYLNKINKNIKVTGFNNSKLRKYLKMDFTTVDINYKILAESSVSLLINKIEKKEILENNIIVDSIIINE